MGCGVKLANDCNATWCVCKGVGPGQTVNVNSVMGQSDPSDVGEVLRYGVGQMK